MRTVEHPQRQDDAYPQEYLGRDGETRRSLWRRHRDGKIPYLLLLIHRNLPILLKSGTSVHTKRFVKKLCHSDNFPHLFHPQREPAQGLRTQKEEGDSLKALWQKLFTLLEPAIRLERTTCGLRFRCSAIELHRLQEELYKRAGEEVNNSPHPKHRMKEGNRNHP